MQKKYWLTLGLIALLLVVAVAAARTVRIEQMDKVMDEDVYGETARKAEEQSKTVGEYLVDEAYNREKAAMIADKMEALDTVCGQVARSGNLTLVDDATTILEGMLPEPKEYGRE